MKPGELGAEGDQVQRGAAEPVQTGDLEGVAGTQQRVDLVIGVLVRGRNPRVADQHGAENTRQRSVLSRSGWRRGRGGRGRIARTVKGCGRAERWDRRDAGGGKLDLEDVEDAIVVEGVGTQPAAVGGDDLLDDVADSRSEGAASALASVSSGRTRVGVRIRRMIRSVPTWPAPI